MEYGLLPKTIYEFSIAMFSTGPQLLRIFLTSPRLQISSSLWLSIWILETSTGIGCSGMCQGLVSQVPPLLQYLKALPVPSVTHIQDALEQHAVPDPPVIPCLHSQVGEPHTRNPELVVGGIQALKLLVLFWCHEAWMGKSSWERHGHRGQKELIWSGMKTSEFQVDALALPKNPSKDSKFGETCRRISLPVKTLSHGGEIMGFHFGCLHHIR